MVSFSRFQETTDYNSYEIHYDITKMKYDSWVSQKENGEMNVKVPGSVSSSHSDIMRQLFCALLLKIATQMHEQITKLQVYQLAVDNAAKAIESVDNTFNTL